MTSSRAIGVSGRVRVGFSVGEVVRKLTEPIDIQDFHIAASKNDPRYLVESDASGERAAHKPEVLIKLS